jgi:hypothetical protein
MRLNLRAQQCLLIQILTAHLIKPKIKLNPPGHDGFSYYTKTCIFLRAVMRKIYGLRPKENQTGRRWSAGGAADTA